MNGAKFTGFITVFVALLCRGYAQDAWTDTRAAYESLYNHYYNGGTSLTDIVPALNQDSPLQVTMAMTLSSLNGFDAVKGQIDISGSMLLEWNDEVAFDQPLNAHTGVSEILIDYDKAWSPSIVLVNAVDTVKNIGDTTYKLKYLPSQQKVQWQPRVLLRASCSPDVTYYPFDRQVCNFTYTAWGHTSSEIQLRVGSSEWDTSDAENNGVWEIISTSSEAYESGGTYYVRFQLTIEREPLYFTFNIVLPILLLGLLNGFVFLLPAESGERVGFCITCFLSFVVLMQTTMNFLPELASPLSLLCIYVFLMMCCSVTINILCVLSLRVYHKPEKDKVSGCMQTFVRIVSCRICRCCRCCTKKEGEKPQDGVEEHDEIDWPTVGRLLDTFFFIAFIGLQSAMTVFFLVPLGTRY